MDEAIRVRVARWLAPELERSAYARGLRAGRHLDRLEREAARRWHCALHRNERPECTDVQAAAAWLGMAPPRG
jgi:hypothetical protein